MNKAANESISAVYKTGCEIERELVEVTKQRDALVEALRTARDRLDYNFLLNQHDAIDAALAAVKGGEE